MWTEREREQCCVCGHRENSTVHVERESSQMKLNYKCVTTLRSDGTFWPTALIISQRHHARVIGTGLFHGDITSNTVPIV